MHKIQLLCVLLLALILPASLRGAPPGEPDPQEIARLIRRLGSENVKEVESSVAALRKVGDPALEMVRKAARSHSDYAVAERAGMLARIMRSRPGQVWSNYVGKWNAISMGIHGVNGLAFSPDGRLLASHGGLAAPVSLWKVDTGALVRHIDVGNREIKGFIFSHDGRYLAGVNYFESDDQPVDVTQERGSAIYLWEVATGKLAHRFKGSPSEWSVAFTPDDTQLISTGNTVRWWDLKTGKESKSFQLPGFNRFFGPSPDGHYVMAHKPNKESLSAASVIDLTNGKEAAYFPFGSEGQNTPETVA